MRRFLFTGLFMSVFAASASAEELVADLSDHLIEVTMGFEGAELLLFGSVEEEGEVIVLVHGPREDITIRRKDQIGGIWMNRSEMTFANIPAFYEVMVSRKPNGWLHESVQERHQIGVDNLRLPLAPEYVSAAGTADAKAFREALIRRKQALGHYAEGFGEVRMLSPRLFRTDVTFPTNVPVGNYTVEVFLIKNGEVVGAQTTPLYIRKTGVLAEIFFFAYENAAAYGVLAIIFAVLAGLGANAAFRKV
jgi:uncharacterized protein (TIGR02186 family)